MTEVVAHFLMFIVVGGSLLGAPLLLGRLLRPSLPTQDKLEIYECGEPTIGSSLIQFDLRFYTIALLFLVFDVELVFFFPWVVVFGSSLQLADQRLTSETRTALSERLLSQPSETLEAANSILATSALQVGWAALLDLLIFFGVLVMGFAYLWKRGDLEWVRTMTSQTEGVLPGPRALNQTTPQSGSPVTSA